MTERTTAPKVYIRQPNEVEAVRYTGDNVRTVLDWIAVTYTAAAYVTKTGSLRIRNVTGSYVDIEEGYWVAYSVDGEFYPVANDIFESLYRPKVNTHDPEVENTTEG